MGKVYSLHCKKCNFKFEFNFGIGMLYPVIYEKTIISAKNGELGENIKQFFIENPDGVIDISKVLARCTQCGQYELVQDLSLYLSKDIKEKYPIFGRLKDNYKLFSKYQHYCKICNGEMKIFKEEDLKKHNKNDFICPICNNKMIIKNCGFWD